MVDQNVVDKIFIPGIDEGIWLAEPQNLQPWRRDAAEVDFVSICSDTPQRLNTYDNILSKEKWAKSVVFPTALVVASHLSVAKATLSVGKKVVLNSTSGTRFRNKILQKDKETEAAITERLRQVASENRLDIPVYPEDYRDLPLVIEAKNFFNFYHFVKESFPLLTLYKKHQLRGKIIIAGGGPISGFIQTLIAAWFPDLVDAVEINNDGGALLFEKALFGLSTTHLYFQTTAKVIQEITDVGVNVPRKPSAANVISMSRNSIEQSLLEFRNHAAKITSDGKPARRRLYITRKAERVRNVVGEELLIERLKKFGFEVASFEDYDQLGQAKLMWQTEAMVTLHGAGLTNMLFMQPGAHVIELSNLQTLRKRYGDFTPLAIAAKVHYCHAFVDHDFDPPSEIPVISQHGLRGVRIDEFQADVLSSWIGKMVEPERVKKAERDGISQLSDDSAHLAEFILANRYLLSDNPEFHLMDFELQIAAGDKKAALVALERAITLDPSNIQIQKSLLSLAAELKNEGAFQAGSVHARRYGGSDIRSFYNSKGWTFKTSFADAPGKRS